MPLHRLCSVRGGHRIIKQEAGSRQRKCLLVPYRQERQIKGRRVVEKKHNCGGCEKKNMGCPFWVKVSSIVGIVNAVV